MAPCPRDDEERALAVAVDLEPALWARRHPPRQWVEGHQRPRQCLPQPLWREEHLRLLLAAVAGGRRRGRGRRVVVDERCVRLGHGEVEVGEPEQGGLCRCGEGGV
ncbi:hypothetical protein ZWY2020_050729 [Hordeum vulgare]|nr:hypothetical protein ZWY2020_050729 [Hordeum vulgare]